MTKTQILIEAVRQKLDGATDYRIAKTLELPRPRVHEYVKGTSQADAYAATKIALQLGRDPLEVIAEIESEAATTPEKREFWKSFHSGLTQALFGGVLLLTGSSLMPGQTGKAEAATASHNGRLRQRPTPNNAARKGGFFWLMTPNGVFYIWEKTLKTWEVIDSQHRRRAGATGPKRSYMLLEDGPPCFSR